LNVLLLLFEFSKEIAMKILMTAVGILLCSAAVAGDGSKVVVATFEALDKNADHQISRTEAAGEKALSDTFAVVDTDGDGYVTKTEYAARTKNLNARS
jgi:Ca2+-binding EF-hand superfamily protein